MGPPLLGGNLVIWRGQTYLAHPYPDAPEYRYLTNRHGARFVVPASEVVPADLRAVVEWICALYIKISK